MIIVFQFILFLFLLIFIFYIQRYLSNSLNLALLSAIILGAVIIFQPTILSSISTFFGIGRGVDLVIYMTIPFLAIWNIRLSIKIKKQSEKFDQHIRNNAINDFTNNIQSSKKQE
jgi:hypothetical protein